MGGRDGDQWQTAVAEALEWSEAHPTFDASIADFPRELRGLRPDGLPHSVWELVEHIRLAQADLIALVTDAGYTAPAFPDGYWPPSPEPPSAAAWNESVEAVRRGRARLRELAMRARADALERPDAAGPTALNAVLQAIDHTSYHLGQIVLTRRLLGAWPGA